MNEDSLIVSDLDDSWISEFEKIDREYRFFYKKNITFINIRCIYVDTNLDIIRFKKNKVLLNTPNYLSREEIISVIKNNTSQENMKYSLVSIIRYNFDLEPFDLNTFLKSTSTKSFLSVVKNIDSIYFSPSIYSFQDLNELIFVFYEKPEKNATNGVTKKVFIKSRPNNKTIRKELKVNI